MIAKKYFQLVFIVIMALLMSAFMSAAMTLANIGLASEFFIQWIKAFATSSIVAIPVAYLVAPQARKFAEILTK